MNKNHDQILVVELQKINPDCIMEQALFGSVNKIEIENLVQNFGGNASLVGVVHGNVTIEKVVGNQLVKVGSFKPTATLTYMDTVHTLNDIPNV